jgi:hypothetical protein
MAWTGKSSKEKFINVNDFTSYSIKHTLFSYILKNSTIKCYFLSINHIIFYSVSISKEFFIFYRENFFFLGL